jgi:hypothetical protein
MIVVAILAKDKESVLPTYLNCILNQTYPKKNIHLYIRTNDNKDNTAEILSEFVKNHLNDYASIYFNSESISETLKEYENHEWNTERFLILGKIRQESIDHAIKLDSNYFVADCDNFVIPTILQDMIEKKELGVISPLMDSSSNYSNFHSSIDKNGYFKSDDIYQLIRWRQIKGLISVPVVHCTYFINRIHLQHVCYDDKSFRYEYVIFSHSLRKKNITQYIDNTKDYGFVTFATSTEDFKKDSDHFTLKKYSYLINGKDEKTEKTS